MTGCSVLTKHKWKPRVETQNSKWAVLRIWSYARACDNKRRRDDDDDDDVDLPPCSRRTRRANKRDKENGCCSGTRDSISIGKFRVKKRRQSRTPVAKPPTGNENNAAVGGDTPIFPPSSLWCTHTFTTHLQVCFIVVCT